MTIDWWGKKWGFGIGMFDIRPNFIFLTRRYSLGFKVWKPT